MDEVFKLLRDFPGSAVIGTSPSNVGDVAFIPVWGAKILCASQPQNQAHTRNNIVTNSMKTSKMVHVK